VDGERGAIAPGKISDLVLVDGNVGARIGNLRHVEYVVLGDRLMEATALREAAGLTGAPR
jgi:imidazolonepropionase-like amidohydrolase